ncbi:MAG: RsmE family RNA methyltransferase [Acidiferrobacterales bacterium]
MFYFPALASAEGIATLAGNEGHHAGGARRLAVGDDIWLFDGHGTVGRAKISAIDRRKSVLQAIIDECCVVPAPQPRIELACALPKGERQSILLENATQLGINAFWPLQCDRSIVKPGANASRRWQRICVEACKQSRRPHLPVIHKPVRPEALMSATAVMEYAIWVAHPPATSRTLQDLISIVRTDVLTRAILLVVGPEGGFTDAEVASLVASGAQTVSLGPAILRIETAAIALLAYVALRAGLDE